MVRVFSYYHSALRYAGVWTVKNKYAPQPEDATLTRLTREALNDEPLDEDDLM